MSGGNLRLMIRAPIRNMPDGVYAYGTIFDRKFKTKSAIGVHDPTPVSERAMYRMLVEELEADGPRILSLMIEWARERGEDDGVRPVPPPPDPPPIRVIKEGQSRPRRDEE